MLVGPGAVGGAAQGRSVALSSVGDTAILGGPYDDDVLGAAWVFTRSNGVWTPQAKLVPNNATGDGIGTEFGASVALSSDGNVALIGGPFDNNDIGSAWIFIRTDGIWSQQAKLSGTNGSLSNQGSSVALAGEGDYAIVGGQSDNHTIGAAWAFAQSGGVWTQQGAKLVGNDVIGQESWQGASVAVPFGNPKTALVGGPYDNSNAGAVWVFTQSGGVWSQQQKLFGLGATDAADQGGSVALSSDARLAAVGGSNDSPLGAVWVFVSHSAAATHDSDGDGFSDILWRDTSGNVATWQLNGGIVLSSGIVGSVPSNWSIIGHRDFDRDTDADILWRDNGGNLAMWLMNGGQVASTASLGNVPTNWTVSGTGDLNGDRNGDLLWRDNSSGTVAVWFMNGSQVVSTTNLGTVPTNWSIVGDDNRGHIIWRDTAGDLAVWRVEASEILTTASLGNIPVNWTIAGIGDFNGDCSTDILWRDTITQTVAIWFLNDTQLLSTATVGVVPSTWTIVQTGDYDGNGTSDILWKDSSGNLAIWFMNGATIAGTANLGNVGTTWSVQAQNSE